LQRTVNDVDLADQPDDSKALDKDQRASKRLHYKAPEMSTYHRDSKREN